MFFIFILTQISKLRWPIGAKFCVVIGPKKILAAMQNMLRFGPILDKLKLRRQISSERMMIFKIKQVHFSPKFLPR